MKAKRNGLGGGFSSILMRGLSILLLLAAFGGSRAHAADQWFDSGTGAGIQPSGWTSTGGLVWADSPLGNNMWANTSAGTNAPLLWGPNNNAFFTAQCTATVTVNGATANYLSFNTGYWLFQQGSAALTIYGGLTNTTSDNTWIIFETDVTLANNQTWYQAYRDITVKGKISGATLTKTGGAATLTLTNAANQFAGLVLKAGTVKAYNNSLGGSSANLTLGGADADSQFATLTLDTIVAGNNTFTNGNLTVAGANRLNLQNTVANSTNILYAQTLGRTGKATLGLWPSSTLGTINQVFFTGGTAMVNAMLPPWVMSYYNSNPTFVSNDVVRGLVPVTYDTGGWDSSKKVAVNGVTLNTATNAYALQAQGANTVNATLTLGDNSTFAGLAMNSSSLVGSGTLGFGAAELIVGINSSCSIGLTLSGSGGLTLNNPNADTLVISNMTYTGDTWINGGTLRVAPTGTTTYTNAINGVGSLSKYGPGTLILKDSTSFIGGAVDVRSGPLVFSNANFRSGGAVTIGNNYSNNTVTVLSNSTWNLAGQTLKVGDGTATGNMLTINAGTVTNTGIVTVGGSSAGANGNSLTITNGGGLFGDSFQLGMGATSISNSLTVGGAGATSYLTTTKTTSYIGESKSSGNTMTTTNAVIVTPQLFLSHNGGTNNMLTVLANTYWNFSNGKLNIGDANGGGGTAVNNVMTVNGGVVTNVASIEMGSGGQGSVGSSLIVTNGGQLFVNGATSTGYSPGSSSNTFNVGGSGASCTVSNGGALTVGNSSIADKMNVTNANLWSAGLTSGGVAGSNNVVNVYADTTWNLLNAAINVGVSTVCSSNAFNIYGGIITNVNGVNLNGNFGTMTVTNARLWTANAVSVGYASSTNNTLTVLTNVVWNFNNGNLNFGTSSGNPCKGSVFVVNGGVVTNVAAVITGNNGSSKTLDSSLTVTNGGQLFINGAVTLGSLVNSNNSFNVGGLGAPSTVSAGGAVNVGGGDLGSGSVLCTLTVTNATLRSLGGSVGINSSTNNTARVQAGGYWSTLGSALTVGGTSTGNLMFVQSGGILEANSLITSAGAGNLITNSGGIYQFTTATPTITTNNNAGGSIFLNSGVIAFRNVTTANVTNNWKGSQLTNITFSGANAFRLNNATNNAGGAGQQTYWFDSGTGFGATNYAGLEMVGGNTAYTNGSVTIGTNGWLTFSDTTNIMWGAVTNYGRMTVNNSSVTFTNGLVLNSSPNLTMIWASNSSVSVNGTLALPASMVFSNSQPIALGTTVPLSLSATTITGSAGGWTVYPTSHRVVKSGNSLVLEPRLPGFLFYVQ